MAKEAETAGYSLPYLFDESQDVAKAYHAACAPDFYPFERNKTLVDHGNLMTAGPIAALPLLVPIASRLRRCTRRQADPAQSEVQPRLQHKVDRRQRANILHRHSS